MWGVGGVGGQVDVRCSFKCQPETLLLFQLLCVCVCVWLCIYLTTQWILGDRVSTGLHVPLFIRWSRWRTVQNPQCLQITVPPALIGSQSDALHVTDWAGGPLSDHGPTERGIWSPSCVARSKTLCFVCCLRMFAEIIWENLNFDFRVVSEQRFPSFKVLLTPDTDI